MSRSAARFRRLVGSYSTGRDGPTLLVCGGLHGNEPAGVLAAERFLARLEVEGPPLRGEFVAVAGNVAALRRNRRYLAYDLNRCWTPAGLKALRTRDPREADTAEDTELRELLELVSKITKRATGRVVFLDLHTTSGASPPFALMGDTLRNRSLAFYLPLPVILGLEEAVEGTLLEYLTEQGHSALVVEAGKHDDPLSVDLHEAVIWQIVAAAGLLEPALIPDHLRWRTRLRGAARGLPRVVEVRHRHGVVSGDGFVMTPGFQGFQRVSEGELLARDRGGEIRACEGGILLMPLYQDQGSDGFFIIRAVNRAWLLLSAALRRLKLHVLLPMLPGVRRERGRPNTLRINSRVARLFPVEVFHLFGYRRHRPEGNSLVFSRRRPP